MSAVNNNSVLAPYSDMTPIKQIEMLAAVANGNCLYPDQVPEVSSTSSDDERVTFIANVVRRLKENQAPTNLSGSWLQIVEWSYQQANAEFQSWGEKIKAKIASLETPQAKK